MYKIIFNFLSRKKRPLASRIGIIIRASAEGWKRMAFPMVTTLGTNPC
jgi:hypothetical protein